MTGGTVYVAKYAARLLLVLWVGWAASVDGASGDQARPSETAIASNQSVSLSEAELAEGADTEPSVPANSQASDGGADLPRPVETASQPASTRSVKRVRPGGGIAVSADGGASPWYRSGVGALAIVLGLVACLYWAVRRWTPSARAAETGLLRVAARASLSPKHGLALIQLGNRFVLVGIGPNRVDAICDVTDPEEVALLAARTTGRGSPSAQAFDDLLDREAAGFRSSSEGSAGASFSPAARPPGAIRDLLNRLRMMQST